MMMDNQSFFCRKSVERRIPGHIRVLQVLLYFTVFISALIGMLRGVLWLIPTLGSLFLCWYMMGEARVSYEYQLDGYMLKVLRISGMRHKSRVVDFLNVDLRRLIIMAEDGLFMLDEAEAASRAAVPRRITYDVSAHDPDKGCYVMYATGIGEEEGRHLKIYISPDAELLGLLRRLCPGKVHVE